jgi:hypothetical protein
VALLLTQHNCHQNNKVEKVFRFYMHIQACLVLQPFSYFASSHDRVLQNPIFTNDNQNEKCRSNNKKHFSFTNSPHNVLLYACKQRSGKQARTCSGNGTKVQSIRDCHNEQIGK